MKWSLAIGAVVLAACGHSPETQFFTLDPVAPQGAMQQAAQAAAVRNPIKVDAVHIPAALDRLAIVQGESGNQLTISDQNRWGAPIDDMTRRVLTQDLSKRLGPTSILPPDAPTPDNARGIVVNIQQFQPDSSGNVVLDADWSLLAGSPSQPVATQSVHLTEAGGMGPGAQAAAMSKLLGQLADRIAGEIVASDAKGNPEVAQQSAH